MGKHLPSDLSGQPPDLDEPARSITGAGTGSRFRRHSLRTYLNALVLVALLPVIVVVTLSVWRAGSAYRDASRNQLQATAHSIAQAVSSELDARAVILGSYAASMDAPLNDDDDNGAWLASPALRLTGRLIIDRVPIAQPLPAGGFSDQGIPFDTVAAALQSGQPAVSNLLGKTSDDLSVAIVAPGPIQGDTRLVLAQFVEPQQLVRALSREDAVASDVLLAVTDGDGRIVARSHHPEQLIGRKVPDWANLQLLNGVPGLFEARTLEGGRVMFAFHGVSRAPGWVAVVGEPLSAYNARWRNPLGTLALLASAATIATLLLAALLARWLLRPVRELADHAQRVAGGDIHKPFAVAPSPIAEFETLRTTLQEAEIAMRQRAETIELNEQRYRALAHHDVLTDLPNRLLFRERLEHAVARARRDKPGALLLLDLDRFKEVNDNLGHPVGDVLLRLVADRLRAQIREVDTAARLGGDEFALVQSDIDWPDAAVALAQRLVEQLSAPYDVQGHRIEIGVSIGLVAITDTDPDVIFREVDKALYRAKAQGRGCYSF